MRPILRARQNVYSLYFVCANEEKEEEEVEEEEEVGEEEEEEGDKGKERRAKHPICHQTALH